MLSRGLGSQGVEFAGSIFLRCLTAALSLLGARISHQMLSADGFVAFGACMTAVALSAVLLFPINRRFWAYYDADVFQATLFSGAVIVALATPIVTYLLMISVQHAWLGAAIWALCSTALAIAYHVSRYSYGSMVLQRSLMKGQVFLLALPAFELLALMFMAIVRTDELAIRLFLPAAMFLLSVPAINRLIGQKHFAFLSIDRIGSEIRQSHSVLFSGLGFATVVAAILLTVSATIDRFAFSWACQAPGYAACGNIADLVLIALYCSGLQSLSNLLVDWSRARIFLKGEFQQSAKRSVYMAEGGAVMLGMMLGLGGWIVGRLFGLIPDSIGAIFWFLMVTRYTLFSCINIAQLDRWGSNQIKLVLPAWALICVISPACLMIGAGRGSMEYALAGATILTLCVALWELIGFSIRAEARAGR